MTREQRETKFELLRILSMLMIVLYHLSYHWTYLQLRDPQILNEANAFLEPVVYPQLVILELFMPLGKMANALFLIVSGYFMVEKGNNYNLAGHLIKLIGQVIFVAGIGTVASFALVNMDTHISAIGIETVNEVWWFVGYYIIIVVIAKWFLNKVLLQMNRLQYIEFVLALFTITSLYWSGNLLDEAISGLRILCAGIFYYCMGGLIRKYDIFNSVRSLWLLLIMVLSIVLIIVSYCNKTLNSINQYVNSNMNDVFIHYSRTYNEYSIEIAALSISLFTLIQRIHIRENRIINKIASASFMVYLIHDQMLVRSILRKGSIIKFLNESPVKYCAIIFLLSILFYFVGYVAYEIYILSYAFLKKLYIGREENQKMQAYTGTDRKIERDEDHCNTIE